MEDKKKATRARNTSIDIAKTIAFLGMSVLSYILIFNGSMVLESIPMIILHGKFTGALFFLLGVSFFLMVKKYVRYGNMPKLSKIRNQVIYRSLFFIILGYLLFAFWPNDILHIYGIFIIIGIIVMNSKSTVLWSISFLLIAGFAILFGAMEFPSDWYDLTNSPVQTFSPKYQISKILYLGKYSVVPYAAFFILGIWYSGLKLTKPETHLLVFRIALPVFIILEIGSLIFKNYIPQLEIGDFEWLVRLLSTTQSNPPLPLFVISTLAFSLSLASGSYLLKEKFDGNSLIKILERGGRMLFTLLVFQALLGILTLNIFSEVLLQSIGFTIIFNVLFVFLSITIVLFMSISNRRGPIEGLMRSFTGYKKKK
ncbi:MAG: DUF418 domain-containing protein [Bacteroidota bacterium]|nr:DUF418 domain-containing protein [Bacteroidota bacterium]